MLYKKELNKIIILLAVGLILSIAFLINALTTYSGSLMDLNLTSYLVLLVIMFYPLGIVYGWRQILNMYNNMRRSDREHWANGRGRGYTALVITFWNLSFSFLVTIFFGWIYGVINAWRKLKSLKNAEL